MAGNIVTGVPSEIRSPAHSRIKLYYAGYWAKSRLARLKYSAPPILMPTPARLAIQHTSQGVAPGHGVIPVYSPINYQGDTFVNAPNATLQILNASGQTVIVRVVGEQACNQGYYHDYTISVQSGNTSPAEIGPFDFHYNDGSGVVHVLYSFNTAIVPGVSVAVVAP